MFDCYHILTKAELAEYLDTTEDRIDSFKLIQAQQMINTLIPEFYSGYFARFFISTQKYTFESFTNTVSDFVVDSNHKEGYFNKSVLTVLATGKQYWIEKSEPTDSGANTKLILENITDYTTLGSTSPIMITQECFYPYYARCQSVNNKIVKYDAPDFIKTAVYLQYQFILNNKSLNQNKEIKSKSLNNANFSVSFGDNKRFEDYIDPQVFYILNSEGILANYV